MRDDIELGSGSDEAHGIGAKEFKIKRILEIHEEE